MQASFESLPPAARAAIPEQSGTFSPGHVLWEETLAGGTHWSGVMRRGTTLRITDVSGTANVCTLLFNQEEKSERYNMPDTLKAQHTAFLTRGNVCFSDMWRILCSIPEDSCGWHDTFCGVLDDERMQAQYGQARYQEHRNAMHRSGRGGLLIEMNKWALGRRDLVANLNLFSKVTVDEAGALSFDAAHRKAGQYIDLRFEMNVLVVLSAAPHPMDPARVWGAR
jgi:urea carboxylase-associated protein 2